MKRLFTTLAAALLMIGVQQISVAQKIAHVQLDSLIQLMPETKQAMDIAQAYLKDLEKSYSETVVCHCAHR